MVVIITLALVREAACLIEKKCLVETVVFADVYIANRKIKSKEKITKDDISMKQIKLNTRSNNYIFNQKHIIGKQAKYTVIKGSPFVSRSIERIPDISKGDNIQVLLQSKNYEIKADAVALDSGMIGDMIRLKTETKKIFRGKIIDEKHIIIAIN